jgi:serine/threonine protein kinase
MRVEGSEALPANFEPYRFERLLGSGGLAAVYLVEDTRTHIRRLMKVGNPDLDASAQTRFQTEAGALAQFHHPHIPVLCDFGMLPSGRPFLVTEWVDGMDLSAILSSGRRLSIH